MELPKDYLKKKVEVNEESNLLAFQNEALEICEDFGITGPYKGMIFRHAKKNMAYLKGRVANVKEKFGDVSDKGRYLIATFRKKKPWE